MTTAQQATRLSLLERILDSPLLGFAPWIAISLISGPHRFVLAASVALGMALLFTLLDKFRGESLKLLGIVDLIFFVAFLAIGLGVSTGSRRWLETWFNELSNIILVIIVAGSLLARVPFTMQYAREEVEPEHWNEPEFVRINYVVTSVWGLAFFVAAVAGFVGDAALHNNSNLWTSWIIQIAATVVAAQFSDWYPNYAAAARLQNEGHPTERPEPVAAFLLPLAGYLIPAGVISVTVGAGPDALGYALIAGGVVLAGWLHRQVARKRRWERQRHWETGL